MHYEIRVTQCVRYMNETGGKDKNSLPLGFVNELPCDGVDQMSFINIETLIGNDSGAYVTTSSCHNFGGLALMLP